MKPFKGFEFEVWQDGIFVAGCWAMERDRAMSEAMHYLKVYGQDGPAELKEKVGRRRTTIALSAGTRG